MKKLSEKRKRHQVSASAIARVIGLHPSTVLRWESGEIWTGLTELERYSAALDAILGARAAVDAIYKSRTGDHHDDAR